jgi:hypothetical protein
VFDVSTSGEGPARCSHLGRDRKTVRTYYVDGRTRAQGEGMEDLRTGARVRFKFDGPPQMATAKLNGLPATVMAKIGVVQGEDYYMIRFDDGLTTRAKRSELSSI